MDGLAKSTTKCCTQRWSIASDQESEIIHRELDTDVDNPASEIAMIVIDLEGKDQAELATMYEVADRVIDDLFLRLLLQRRSSKLVSVTRGTASR